jgi:hypothetical protein
LERLKEELDDRIGVDVSIYVSKRDYLINPAPTGGTIEFEVQVGNWNTVQVVSEFEPDRSPQGVFYFLRRLLDKTMYNLIRIGAQRA